MPLLSIIVTVYNLEQYIEECLNSILHQDFNDYEIIVVDDGSTDKSKLICGEYATKYSDKVKVINLPSPGVLGRAHKIGFEQASGEYIQMIDGDDYLEKNCYQNIIAILKQNNPDILMGTYRCIVEEGAIPLNDAKINGYLINKGNYAITLNYLENLQSFHMIFWRYIFKKSLLKGENLFDSNVVHTTTTNDWLPAIKILVSAESIYYNENPFYYYRRRAYGSITSKITKEHLVDHFLTVVELVDFLNNSRVENERFDFVISRIGLILNIAFCGEDLLTEEDWYKIGMVIDKHQNDFNRLTGCKNVQIQQLNKYIQTYRGEKGIKLFCENTKKRFLNAVHNEDNKEIYIFPTGFRGEAVARIFKNEGLKVKGFFDNDYRKCDKLFEGLPCYSPEIVKTFSKYTLEHTIIVIAPLYEKLNEILKKQLIDNHILNENIIILS